MNLLRRLLRRFHRSLPNPDEQHLRTHARRVAAVAHARAADLRGEGVRADYRRGDARIAAHRRGKQ